LDYQYYEGSWINLPDFASLTPVKTGTVNNIDLGVRGRDSQYGLRFQGYINVPADGQYTFYTSSDDGSRLLIGSTQVVNNDGAHGVTELSGTVGLKAGRHAVTVLFFQGGGGQDLTVSYAGPGINKQVVPASAWFRVDNSPPVVLRDPENPTNVVSGLDYQYYEGNWSTLPDFNSLTPNRTGTTSNVDLGLRSRDTQYGLRFKGYINIPADGQYTFYTSSDDGSKLLIGTTEVVNNDGLHDVVEKSGTIGLKAGKHAITILYLQGTSTTQQLTVSYAGPGVNKQVIPTSTWYRVNTTPTPTLRDPENPADVVAGLDYQYYEGSWSTIPDFNPLTPKKTGTVSNPDLTVRSRDSEYGIRFKGYINVPADGQYTFYTTSDDGSKLLIGNTEVVNNDGMHASQERSGTIGLKAGKHAVTVLFLQGGGGQELTVSYEGPGVSKQAVPASAWYRTNTTPTPVVLRDPENPADVVSGLDYQYYEGNWSSLPDYNSLTPNKTGASSNIDLGVRNRDTQYGIRFKGYINIPTDGQYTFYTNSDDGSKLLIGTTEVVNNDGLHDVVEKSGTIGLKAGKHAITILYLQGTSTTQQLTVSYSSPNLGKQVVPASSWYRVNTPAPVTLRDPENPANTVSGLDYQYYEGSWINLPDFNSLTPKKTGTTTNIDLSARSRDSQYGLRFQGYINVPADGQYTFYTTSDDGSNLLIGTTEVVNNDGSHGSQERSGTIGLKAGRHAITVLFFQGSSGQELTVSYAGPGVSKQLIPASAWFRVGSSTPTPTLRDPENPADAVAGLDYQYYEGSWSTIPDFNPLTPKKTGTVSNTDLTVRGRDSQYGIRFKGYINIPADGQYTLYTTSDDGSKLLIGTTEVVNNDGMHAAQEKSGTIGLKAGKHAITILFLQGGGGQELTVSYAGPGVNKQVVPASAWFRVGNTPTPVVLRDPENPTDAVGGLDYQYYEGSWSTIPDFNPLTPTKTGTTSNVDLTVRSRDTQFGLRFRGYINVPADGQYTFYTTSDDGSKLLIGNTEVVNNDGVHGSQEKSGTIGLKAGKHAITVLFFQGTSGYDLKVSYAGPGVSKQLVPASAWFRVGTSTPTPTLRDPENPADAVAGLDYQYYEGSWNAIPNFSTLTPKKTGTIANTDLSVRGRDSQYGLRFQGYINIPADGQYTFYTTSDDGSKLLIGTTEVVNNDGMHASQERSGVIGLKAGKHAITVLYLQGSGGQELTVSYAGPGVNKQVVPASAWFRVGSTTPTTPANVVYLSDIPWVSATNGYGPVERDRSNGDAGATDGRTITLNGVSYAKGLGAHANSEIVYNLAGLYTTFVTDVGVDDEMASTCGSVEFMIYADNVLVYSSGTMTTTTPTKSVTLNVSNKQTLKLVLSQGTDNNNCDHGDWAGAYLIRANGGRLAASNTEANVAVLVYPVPAHDELQINYNAETDGELALQLVNAAGQSVKEERRDVVGGQNQLRLAVGNLHRGVYTLMLQQGRIRITRKVILSE
jgi:hypothetical protein